MTGAAKNPLSLGLKIAAGYLIFVGGSGLLGPLLDIGPRYSEFEALSTAGKAGVYFRNAAINLAFFTAGIGIFLRKSYSRKIGLVALVVGAFYTANDFAWGYAGGAPNVNARLVSYPIVSVWNGIWFYLLYRRSTRDALS